MDLRGKEHHQFGGVWPALISKVCRPKPPLYFLDEKLKPKFSLADRNTQPMFFFNEKKTLNLNAFAHRLVPKTGRAAICAGAPAQQLGRSRPSRPMRFAWTVRSARIHGLKQPLQQKRTVLLRPCTNSHSKENRGAGSPRDCPSPIRGGGG